MSRRDGEGHSRNTSIDSTDTPKQKNNRRKLTQSTRRRSQLMYLEKYGLNQPGWHSSNAILSYDDQRSIGNNCEMQDVVYTTTVSNTEKQQQQRPVSMKNCIQSTTKGKRPSRFIKPEKSTKNIMSFPGTEFSQIQEMMNIYTAKVYMEGYLYKRNDLNSNGSVATSKQWNSWYVELCGPILTLWNIEQQQGEVYPQYINITDSIVQLQDRLTAETRPHLFSLNSAGANRFLFQAANDQELKQWILSIRLSCFECSLIQEMYTKIFISRSHIIEKQQPQMEGYMQVRLPGSTGWKQYWAVLSNTAIEKSNKKKLFLFNTSKSTSIKNGILQLFDQKKSKYPVMTIKNVVQLYTVYPESPKLINLSTLFKIEGAMYKQQHLVNASSSALIMTENNQDLIKWLLTALHLFKLTLHDNLAFDSKSLFLNTSQILPLIDHRSDLLSNKQHLYSLLANGLSAINDIHESDNTSQNSNDTADDTQPSDGSHSQHSIHSNQYNRPSNIHDNQNNIHSNQDKPQKEEKASRQAKTASQLRLVTCASDISDERDENVDSDESDESLFKRGKSPIILLAQKKSSPPKAVKPLTPNTSSKSGSEISSASSSDSTARKHKSPRQSAIYSSNNYSNSQHWETSSVDPRMLVSSEPSQTTDYFSDEFTQNSILDQQERVKQYKKSAKVAANHYQQNMPPPSKPVPVTSSHRSSYMHERPSSRQQQRMAMSYEEQKLQMQRLYLQQQQQQFALMQQYMQQQQQYNMMMQQQPGQPMMMDPRYYNNMMDPRFITPIPSTSTPTVSSKDSSTSSSNRVPKRQHIASSSSTSLNRNSQHRRTSRNNHYL